MTAILEATGLRKVYVGGDRSQIEVLNAVDLTVYRGEMVAVVGASGAGKSTLLHLLGALDAPTAGSVQLDGRDYATLREPDRDRLRNREIGFVFQFHHLLPAFTAVENVMLPEWGDAGMPTRDMRRRAEEMLAAVGLSDRAQYKTRDLSGGQQQRVAIARAMVRQPPLVLADEPTGNLDTASADDVFELMRRFNREYRTTFLVVTHDPRIAARCGRVIEIVDGRITSDRASQSGSSN